MGLRLRVILCCILLSWVSFSLSLAEEVQLTVRGVTSIASTDDNFVCITLDWWPRNKCDYNQCPWLNAGLLELDLTNKIMLNAMKAFNPMRIRIGGSLQDQLVYGVGNTVKKCPHFKRRDDGLFGFSRGCLPMTRWDELNQFFNQTRSLVTFGLNALIGRTQSKNDKTLWVGDWDPQNARNFMKYSISKGYKIDSYELGNELCGSGVSARVESEQYGKDLIVLKELVKEVHPDASTRPKVLGPGGFYDKEWFNKFLEVSGPEIVDGLTHHIYNLGAGDDPALIDRIQDPYYLDQIAQIYKDVSSSIKKFGPWSGAWVGEAGGAYNSGGKHVSDAFVNGFWYLDQLGMTATFNHKVFCRQALVGGNYALLSNTSFIPKPDYYGALLWHRLMGKTVLSANHNGSSPYLRAYAHCSRNQTGITILLINMSNSTRFDVSVVDDMNLYPDEHTVSPRLKQYKSEDATGVKYREEYQLTPKDGNIQSDKLLLNGLPLVITESLDIPIMNPKLVVSSSPISVQPDSIVFVSLSDFRAPACA